MVAPAALAILLVVSGALAPTEWGLAQAPPQPDAAQGTLPASGQAGVVPAGVKLTPQMPGGAPTKPYPFPKPATRTLPNGLRVFVVSSDEVPSVSVRLVLTSAGTAHDPAGKPGVASMTAAMLTQGTSTRSAQQIAEAIDFVGGTLSASAGSDASFVSASVVKKDLPLALELLADVTRNAAFADEELERQRQQLLSSLRIQYNDPSYLASAVYNRVVYGGHSYGLPAEGTPESARAIARADLAAFRDARYSPPTALLAFAGDITPEAAFAAAEKFFGDWAGPQQAATVAVPAPPARAAGLRVFVVDKPDAVQTQIRIGHPSIRRNHPDYIPLVVSNQILGGGFNSRLSAEVRIRRGLTYGAYSRLDSRAAAGSFFATTFTRTEATAEATKLVVEMLGQMAAGAEAAELEFATDYLAGVFPIQTETAEQIANQILNVVQYGLPADYNDTYRERIRGVTAEQVKSTAARHIRAGDLDVVLVGNAAAFRDALKKEFPGAAWQEMAFTDLDLLAADLRRAREADLEVSPEALARGQALLQAAVSAAGGAALSKVEGFEYAASGSLSTPQGDFPLDLKGVVLFPDRARAEVTLPFATITQGFDGKTAWVLAPQGVVELPAQFNHEQLRSIALNGGWGFLRMVLAGEAVAQFLGEEDVRGRKLLAVASNSPADGTKLYIDPQTGLLVGAAYRASSLEGSFDHLALWDDFREINGMKFPFKVVVYRDGQKFLEQTTQEVKPNPVVDATIFAKPN